MTRIEAIYATLCLLGILCPWYFNLQHIGAGGSNLVIAFFTEPFASPVGASLLMDLLISFIAFNVWMFVEAQRIKLPPGALIACLLVSWVVAMAAGLPLFLLLRERRLQATLRPELRG